MNTGERFDQWVNISPALTKIEDFLIYPIQSLGRLDSKLIIDDNRFSAFAIEGNHTRDELFELMDYYTSSYLWVLGLYELVRTLHEMCKKDRNILGEELTNKLGVLKNKIGRLRMPLAKLEPSKMYKNTDFSRVAFVLNSSFGASWVISGTTFIARRELADDALVLFEEIKGHMPGTV